MFQQSRLELGRRSEQHAARMLASQGYVIEQANVRFPVGEIDLIAQDGQTLCFVEVRSASSEPLADPLESITDRKRRRLVRAARWYLNRLPTLPAEVRFDVVTVVWDAGGRPITQLLRGAFDAGDLARQSSLQ